MNERIQNEIVCEMMGGTVNRWGTQLVGSEYVLAFRKDGTGENQWLPWFTRNDNSCRLMRTALIERGLDEKFLLYLRQMLDGPSRVPMRPSLCINFMQATPAQQVEAALRAIGKWESE